MELVSILPSALTYPCGIARGACTCWSADCCLELSHQLLKTRMVTIFGFHKRSTTLFLHLSRCCQFSLLDLNSAHTVLLVKKEVKNLKKCLLPVFGRPSRRRRCEHC